MAKISIIIPAHEEEKYIKKTLKAIDHPDVETIVVANGCTDKTTEIAKKYATKVIELKEKGVSKARNQGAKEATTNFLIFLDADILVTKDTIEKILTSKYSIGTCHAKPDVNKILPKILMLLKNQVHYFGFSTGLMFCKKEIYDKVGGFDESLDLGEDGKFLRKGKGIGSFGVVDTYVINSMRRFEKNGYMHWMIFWIKRYFQKKKFKKYKVIR